MQKHLENVFTRTSTTGGTELLLLLLRNFGNKYSLKQFCLFQQTLQWHILVQVTLLTEHELAAWLCHTLEKPVLMNPAGPRGQVSAATAAEPQPPPLWCPLDTDFHGICHPWSVAALFLSFITQGSLTAATGWARLFFLGEIFQLLVIIETSLPKGDAGACFVRT